VDEINMPSKSKISRQFCGQWWNSEWAGPNWESVFLLFFSFLSFSFSSWLNLRWRISCVRNSLNRGDGSGTSPTLKLSLLPTTLSAN
ncbi:hypothetical protein PFISCL1PPCAC_24554, partial [Pristionchus fissidentatus]